MSKKNKPEPKRFAELAWTYADVKTLRPRWSRQKCEEFLSDNEKRIAEFTCQKGWEVIEALL